MKTHESFVSAMQSKSYSGLAQLHRDVESVVFTDFPDHANVGDSAIALGQDAFWREHGITVRETYSVTTLPEQVYEGDETVVIHGGGNFGGLYPAMSEHRYRMAERLRAETTLIQLPQSVHFVSETAKEDFARRMAGRDRLRIAVRDGHSKAELEELGFVADLVPDSVHMLGHLDSPDPEAAVIVLARRDDESSGMALPPGVVSVDWIKDPRSLTAATWLRWRARRWEAMKRLGNHSPDRWIQDAQSRMNRGVSTLSWGQTIVTDRLHAMLIGLQMGRKVVAIDNSNQKLSRYAATWFADTEPDVQFAPSFAAAIELCRG